MNKGPRAQVWIELRPDPNRVKVCGRCSEECPNIHDRAPAIGVLLDAPPPPDTNPT